MNKFYKAVRGTEVYEKYGEALIPYEVVAFDMNNAQRRQLEDASAEDLAQAFNESEEFNADIFQALAEMAEVEIGDDIGRDEVGEKIEKILSIKLF